MRDDISTAAAILTAELLRGRISEGEAIATWRRQRGRMQAQMAAVIREDMAARAELPDDSAVFEEGEEMLDTGEEAIQWSSSDDSSRAFFPPGARR